MVCTTYVMPARPTPKLPPELVCSAFGMATIGFATGRTAGRVVHTVPFGAVRTPLPEDAEKTAAATEAEST